MKEYFKRKLEDSILIWEKERDETLKNKLLAENSGNENAKHWWESRHLTIIQTLFELRMLLTNLEKEKQENDKD